MDQQDAICPVWIPLKRSWVPGDKLTAAWEIAHPSQDASCLPITINKVTASLVGKEAVDHKWISSSYHATEAVSSTSARWLVRTILTTEATLDRVTRILPGEKAAFLIRCLLPTEIPPTFAGACVRFSYHVCLTCSYTHPRPPDLAPSPSDVSDASPPHEAHREPLLPTSSSTAKPLQGNGPFTQPRPSSDLELSHRHAVRILPAPVPEASGGGGGGGGSEMESSGRLLPTPVTSPRCSFTEADSRGRFIDFTVLPAAEAPEMVVEMKGIVRVNKDGQLRSRQRRRHSQLRFLWAPNEVDEPGPSSMHTSQTGALPSLAASDPGAARPGVDRGGGPEAAFARERLGRSNSAVSPSARKSDASQVSTPHAAGPARELTPRQELRTFDLALRGMHIARVELHTPGDGPLHPGSTLAGTLDFRVPGGAERETVCHHMSMLLETEEHMNKTWLLNAHRLSGKTHVRKLVSERVEVTRDLLFTSFLMAIPAGATPCFETPILALKWCMRFEFVIGKPGSSGWSKPDELVWRLPLPVHTVNASLGLEGV